MTKPANRADRKTLRRRRAFARILADKTTPFHTYEARRAKELHTLTLRAARQLAPARTKKDRSARARVPR